MIIWGNRHLNCNQISLRASGGHKGNIKEEHLTARGVSEKELPRLEPLHVPKFRPRRKNSSSCVTCWLKILYPCSIFTVCCAPLMTSFYKITTQASPYNQQPRENIVIPIASLIPMYSGFELSGSYFQTSSSLIFLSTPLSDFPLLLHSSFLEHVRMLWTGFSFLLHLYFFLK